MITKAPNVETPRSPLKIARERDAQSGTDPLRPSGRSVVPNQTKRSPPRGRATKLTDQVQQMILVAVGAGTSLETAAEMAGVSPHTLREWRRRGRGDDARPATEPYTTFADKLKRAQATCEIRALGAIYEAARNGQWRASAWLLERRYPSRWGRQRAQQKRKPRRASAPKIAEPEPASYELTEEELREADKVWRAKYNVKSPDVEASERVELSEAELEEGYERMLLEAEEGTSNESEIEPGPLRTEPRLFESGET